MADKMNGNTLGLEAEVILCPHCLVPLHVDDICPVCGERLDRAVWPEISEGNDLSPWSPRHLLPPVDGDHCYRLPLVSSVSPGEILTPLPYAFPSGKRVVRIGSGLRADVRISTASPLHTALLQKWHTSEWWIYDCGSASGTFVNENRVRFYKLMVGDVIAIAGVKLVYRGDQLVSERAQGGIRLSVEDLCFSIEEDGKARPLLNHVSFSVSPGEFIGILGPSGCGKSSLVQRIMGLAKPGSGEISGRVCVNEHLLWEWEQDKDKKSHLRLGDCFDEFLAVTAYLPQDVERTLHGDLTLDEEIDCFRRIHLPLSESKAQENQSLTDLDLVEKDGQRMGAKRIGSMSGGEKRRVGIVLSLLRRPKLLLLDEPCAGLDPENEDRVMRHLRKFADQKRTVLCVTHALANLDVFDKVLVFSKGKVVYFGKPEELLCTFGAKNFGVLYRLLGGGAPEHYTPPPRDKTKSELPEVEEPSCARRMFGYFRRSFKEFFAPLVISLAKCKKEKDKLRRLKIFGKEVLATPPGVLLLVQPTLLAICIRLSRAGNFRPCIEIETLGFCASLAMFWVGINNAARALVEERVPGRCLENLDNVPCSSYLFSKLLWTLFICALQTISFLVLLEIVANIPIPLVQSPLPNAMERTLWIKLLWFLPLYGSCLVGAFLGLAVSAFNKKTMSAIAVVPNIAIFALLFCKLMVWENEADWYSKFAQWLACSTPCHWAAEIINDIQNGHWNDLWGDTWPFFVVFVVTAALSSVLVWKYQRKNEEDWNGR